MRFPIRILGIWYEYWTLVGFIYLMQDLTGENQMTPPKTPPKKPKMRNCYCVKISAELFEALEKKRIENRHNKTAATLP
jgi:hypothetical protein